MATHAIAHPTRETPGDRLEIVAGDNLTVAVDDLSPVEERTSNLGFTDDFTDDDFTNTRAWTTTGTANWSASGNYMANTAHTGQIQFNQSIDHGDAVLDFTYRIASIVTDNHMTIWLRDDDNGNRLQLVPKTDEMLLRSRIRNWLTNPRGVSPLPSPPLKGDQGGCTARIAMLKNPTVLKRTTLQEVSGGSAPKLQTDTDADSTVGTDYDIRVIMDGGNVQVWRADSGGTMEQIIDTTTKVLSGNYLRWKLGEQVTVRVDDIAFVPDEPEITTFTYNDANEMTAMTKDGTVTTYTYDDWGRTTTKTRGSEEATYTWRFGSMLKKVESTFAGEAGQVDCMYDALSKRRFKIVDSTDWTWYRWDAGWNVLAEYADDAGGFWDIGARAATHVFDAPNGVGQALAEIADASPETGTARYLTHDRLGSSRAVFDTATALQGSANYTPYGAPNGDSGEIPHHRFTGKPYDATVGLYYFPYRYYSHDVARWLSRDPLGMVDGPNVYGYVDINPINFTDPLGLKLRDGHLCNDNCDSDEISDVVSVPEGDWEEFPHDPPEKGECQLSDGVYSEKGRLKIPGQWTCTLKCDECEGRTLECLPDYGPFVFNPPREPTEDDGFPDNPNGPN